MQKKKIFKLSLVILISIIIRYGYYIKITNIEASNPYYIDYNLGLGKMVSKEMSNNKSFEWYIDQFDTGRYNYENCGPAAAAMATKWSSNGEKGDATEARSRYKSKGGWWSVLDIESYLKDENISYKEEYSIDKNVVINQLNKGKIIILCIDPRFIDISDNEEEKAGLFYKPSSGHFIVLKGYKLVDDNLYFECYDPASYNSRYKTGELKGKDRYYLADEVILSATVHWNGMLIVS